MTSIEELIAKHCPNGIEFKSLGEVSLMKRGTSLTKKSSTEGKYPAFYCDKYNREGDIITNAGSGTYAGYVQYWNKPIYANDCFTVQGNEKVLTKYIFYFLTNIQKRIYDTKKGGGIPHVLISDIEDF